MLVLYLHGFASSARSSKATFFGKKFLEEAGIRLETPDFNAPDFSTLTVTRMVDQVLGILDACPDEHAVLIGSSLGGGRCRAGCGGAARPGEQPGPVGASPRIRW